MHIKRFEGASLREVLSRVRSELGPDALVVSTRNVPRERGWLGRLAKPIVEVTVALDRSEFASRASADESARVAPDASWRELRLTRALVSPLEVEIRSLRECVEQLSTRQGSPTTDSLEAEIARLRLMVSQLLANRQPAFVRTDVDVIASAYSRAGIASQHAGALEAETQAGPRGTSGSADLVNALARRLDRALRPPRIDGAPIVLYVGPPGAGKTSTLVKIAARPDCAEERPVLLTTDIHRFGGDDMLRACARQLGVPFEAVSSPSELTQSASRFGRRPILVDTAGHSRRDPDALPRLQRLRQALGERARVCLVLPATSKERDLRSDLVRFAALAPDDMAITKLDESEDLGNVANVLLDESAPPLAWIATGQRVPEDLWVADPHDLAKRILGVCA